MVDEILATFQTYLQELHIQLRHVKVPLTVKHVADQLLTYMQMTIPET
jgi:hypothetical protein